ncbi:MAG TPA: hypothetical protein VHA77_18905 [Xanthobacteraceae bacterium]|jgi:hypothetical protein|nr:hypothetical protein [Xanthobacteraceae bacterium]
MWRSVVAIGLIYGSGHPSLDPYRPAVLDRPLQGFYSDVNSVARDGRQMVARVAEFPVGSYLERFVGHLANEARADIERQ